MNGKRKFVIALVAGTLAASGAVIGTAAIATASGSTSAHSTTTGSAGKVQPRTLTSAEVGRLDKQIAKRMTSGGKRISVNQIAWEGGKVVLTVPLPGERKARALNEGVTISGLPCPYEFACLYEDESFEGARLSFTACALRKLNAYDFGNKTSSWINNQTSGTLSGVYLVTTGDNIDVLESTKAPSWVFSVGVLNNDKADYLRVCW